MHRGTTERTLRGSELTRKRDGSPAALARDLELSERGGWGLLGCQPGQRGLEILFFDAFTWSEGEGLSEAAVRARQLLLADVKLKLRTAGLARKLACLRGGVATAVRRGRLRAVASCGR